MSARKPSARWFAPSTSGEGGKLPAGEFGAAQDVVVREVQSVNR
ncbi:hypothetical protein ACFVYR_27655 [Streptomyces sp. NPDC058284]